MTFKLSIFIFVLALVVGCRNRTAEPQYNPEDSVVVDDDQHIPDTVDVFSNDRFRNVAVERVGDSTFEISGKAQVFEAAYSWVVEDGHHELKKGHGMTDAGAPAWGNFTFQVTAAKPDSNSVLHLILFESSAKDGSRQNELPIVLY